MLFRIGYISILIKNTFQYYKRVNFSFIFLFVSKQWMTNDSKKDTLATPTPYLFTTALRTVEHRHGEIPLSQGREFKQVQ